MRFQLNLTYRLFFLFILSSLIGFSQDLGDFNEIKTYDGLAVELIASDKNAVELSGQEKDNIQIENKKGTLIIRMKISKLFSGYKTFVKLYYKDPFSIIQANDESFISIKETITQDKLLLEAYESALIEANLKLDQLLVKAFFNGEVKLTGSSKLQDITINTGGTYSGENLKSSFTTIVVNAGGNASVNATDYVNANVKAGGTVLIYGNPKKVDEKKLFGGFIKRMDN